MSLFKKIFFALRKRERIVFIGASALAVASFAVVASVTIAQSTKAIPTQGGAYNEGMVGQPEYVNPVTAQSETDLGIVKLLYANLPDLADQIDTSADGRTWTVHLKDGLTWQDGQKITSDDVIFTVQSIQNQDANSPLAASWQGVTASRVSELELTFTLTNPYAFFSDNLKNLYVIPKHVFADVPVGNWRLSDYNLKPVGDGPYEFASYDEQSDGFISDYHLSAWSGYAGSQALIEHFNIMFFRNTTDLAAGFDNGTIDGFGDASADMIAALHRPYDLFSWRTTGYYAVFFNQSKNLALQDPVVREALAATAPRDAIVAGALDGHGVVDTGPIPPDALYFSPPAPTTSSADYASSLLDQDGWTMNTSTNFRSQMIQNTSVPLTVNLTVPDIDYLVATAQELQSAWSAIGVQVTIATDTPENIVANTIKNRSYESLIFGNVLGGSSDLYSFWDSSQRFSPGLNLAIYDNPRVDSLIEDARQNLSDASRTLEIADAQSDIVGDNPAVFLFSPDYLYVTGRDVGGIVSDTLIDPSDISREQGAWYLDTARVMK